MTGTANRLIVVLDIADPRTAILVFAVGVLIGVCIAAAWRAAG